MAVGGGLPPTINGQLLQPIVDRLLAAREEVSIAVEYDGDRTVANADLQSRIEALPWGSAQAVSSGGLRGVCFRGERPPDTNVCARCSALHGAGPPSLVHLPKEVEPT